MDKIQRLPAAKARPINSFAGESPRVVRKLSFNFCLNRHQSGFVGGFQRRVLTDLFLRNKNIYRVFFDINECRRVNTDLQCPKYLLFDLLQRFKC